MKYYSEITKKNYDTVEALQEAEQKAQTNEETKDIEKANPRKEAAAIVEKAFSDASAKRKENDEKREALKNKAKEIDKKYTLEFQRLQNKQDEELEKIDEELNALDKEDKQALSSAYDELRNFCKKYGAYHYSVDANGSTLFPTLLKFGQIERAQSLFDTLLNSVFDIF